MTRLVAALCATVGVFLLAPTVAWADPAAPTNYRSKVTSSPEGVQASTLGGDAFVRVRARPGHEVVVLGYSNEPWLRIRRDGTVEENRRSPAGYLNADRYAEVELPEHSDPEAEPEWVPVGDGGEWTWHDHRIHWMSPDLPPVVQAAGGEKTRVFTWQLALMIDGHEEAVWGTLTWAPDEAAVPWLAGGLAVGIVLVVVARRAGGRLSPFLLGAGVVAVVVSFGEWAAQPSGAGAPVMPLLFASLATGLAAAALVAWRRWAVVSRNLQLASLAVLVPWIITRLEVFTEPVLPTALPEAVDRLGTSAVLWVIAGGIALVANALLSATSAALDEKVPV